MEEIINHHKILANDLFEKITLNYRPFYENRIKGDSQGFLQTLAELRVFCLFNNRLELTISRINKKTLKDRDVDLEILINKIPVNIEVYTNNEELERREGKREDAKLERAMRHGLEKFGANECNITVLVDEDIFSLNNDPYFIRDGYQKSIFIDPRFKKISASLILNQAGHLDRDKSFGYILAINENASVKLPELLEEKLKQHAAYVHK